MPVLNNLVCSIELSPSNRSLREYGTTYKDGSVTTYVVVPTRVDSKQASFSISLVSSGFVAEGLAMLVYIDGMYQCNRNSINLRHDGSSKVRFRVRQQEMKCDEEGHFVGRSWAFQDLKFTNDQAEEKRGYRSNAFGPLGTIEVVVLRCRAQQGPLTSGNMPYSQSINHLDRPDGLSGLFDGSGDMIVSDEDPDLSESCGLDGHHSPNRKGYRRHRRRYSSSSSSSSSESELEQRRGRKKSSRRGLKGRDVALLNDIRIALDNLQGVNTVVSQSSTAQDSLHGVAPTAKLSVSENFNDGKWDNPNITTSETGILDQQKNQASKQEESWIQTADVSHSNDTNHPVSDQTPGWSGISVEESKNFSGDQGQSEPNRKTDHTEPKQVAWGATTANEDWAKPTDGGRGIGHSEGKKEDRPSTDESGSKSGTSTWGDATGTSTNDQQASSPSDASNKQPFEETEKVKTAENGQANSGKTTAGNEAQTQTMSQPQGTDSTKPPGNDWTGGDVTNTGSATDNPGHEQKRDSTETWTADQDQNQQTAGSVEGDIKSYIVDKPAVQNDETADSHTSNEYRKAFYTSPFEPDQQVEELTHFTKPLFAIPRGNPVVSQRQLDQQIRLGESHMYVSKTREPEYLDTIEKPFAVFKFRYRSKAALEKILNIDIDEEEDSENFKSRVEKMSRDELVRELLKRKA